MEFSSAELLYLGWGLVIGLGFILNYITEGNYVSLFIWMLCVDAIMVYMEFLELWTFITFLIISIFLIFYHFENKSKQNEVDF